MESIVLKIPNKATIPSFDYSIYLAAKLYEDELLSAGQASALANVSKRVFIELMGRYGVSVFSTKVEDLLEDIAHA